MSERLSNLPDQGAVPGNSELLKAIAGTRGRIPTPFKIWLQSPELAALMHPLGAFIANGTSLSKREAEIAILAVAHHWGSHYVFAVHSREALELGLPKELITAITEDGAAALDNPRENDVYRLIAALAHQSEVDDQTFKAAVASLGYEGIAELMALAGYFSAVSLAMKLFAVPTPES